MSVKKRVLVTLDDAVHERARLLALREQQWNFSQLVTHLLEDYIASNGVLENVVSPLEEVADVSATED